MLTKLCGALIVPSVKQGGKLIVVQISRSTIIKVLNYFRKTKTPHLLNETKMNIKKKMTNMCNFIPLNSFDFLLDFLSNFNLYNYAIVSVLPVLILCVSITTVFVGFIVYSSSLGRKFLNNAGKIGTSIVLGLTGVESGLNLLDRVTGNGTNGNSGGSGSGNKPNNDNNNSTDNKTPNPNNN